MNKKLVIGITVVLLGVAGFFVYKAVTNKPTESDKDKDKDKKPKKVGAKDGNVEAEKVGEGEVVSGTNVVTGDETTTDNPVVVEDAPQVVARQFSVIRKSPTSVAPIIKRISKSGLKYSVLGIENTAGYKWLKIKDGDKEGYIRSDQVNQV